MKKTLIAIFSILMISCAAIAQEPDMIMPKNWIRGVVLLQDGETPVNNLKVRVWDAEKEIIVFKTTTNDDGLFKVPDFDDSGNYYVTIGPVKVDLLVVNARGVVPQHNGFVMVMPKRMPLSATLPVNTVTAATIVTTKAENKGVTIPPPPTTVSP
tara:strand:+ start:3119 stop:3583 length:465 start_codon:yes stop_codon:yes gene_type:complete